LFISFSLFVSGCYNTTFNLEKGGTIKQSSLPLTQSFQLRYPHDKIPFFQFSSAAEFILYKLKELGKVNEADIVDIANEFCSLDYDQNGALKISSFHVPQATDLPA
jgi:hypothetical protein